MKNFTKFFCTAALCLTGAMSANADDVEYVPDQVFTSLEVGQTYAITMDGKALYGTNNQNLGFDEFSTAFVNTNSGYLFKVESLANDADADVKDCYLLRLMTPTGDEYSIWGNPGYLNSQPATGGCSFILGLNGQNGQDGKNLAVWDIQYVDGKGFTMKNVGTGLYLHDNAPAKYEEPAYWTFCTLKEKGDDTETLLTADMFYNWDGYGADASFTSPANVEYHVGEELGGGAMVIGTSTVDYLIYADLTGYSKMVFEGTTGTPLRVLLNRQESNNGPLVEKNPTIGEDGTAELDLTEYEYVHLNAIKTGWSGGGTITAIKLVKPSDPLEMPKEALKKAIALAKMQTPVAKTTESFATLTAAIEAAEAALNAADATAESLEAALANLNAAIEGLELAEGYSNLTKENYNNPYGAYVLYESTGLPYGDSNVDMNNYADLSDYDQLIVTVADGTPRFCFNRTTAAGQDNDDESLSEMIDIPNKAWGTERYQTVDGKTYTINVKKITEDKGNAYLHCIKGANWANVTVTGMYLYKGTATGINNVNAAAQSANVYYDLQGRRVANPANGLYIVNGKKVVVK